MSYLNKKYYIKNKFICEYNKTKNKSNPKSNKRASLFEKATN